MFIVKNKIINFLLLTSSWLIFWQISPTMQGGTTEALFQKCPCPCKFNHVWTKLHFAIYWIVDVVPIHTYQFLSVRSFVVFDEWAVNLKGDFLLLDLWGERNLIVYLLEGIIWVCLFLSILLPSFINFFFSFFIWRRNTVNWLHFYIYW